MPANSEDSDDSSEPENGPRKTKEFVGGLRKSMSRASSMSKSQLIGFQFRVKIMRLKMCLLEPLPATTAKSCDSWKFPVRKPIIRGVWGNLRASASRSAPIDAWEFMKEEASIEDPEVDAGDAGEPQEEAHNSPSLGGQAIPGWIFATVSVSSIDVRAPVLRPLLRNVVKMKPGAVPRGGNAIKIFAARWRKPSGKDVKGHLQEAQADMMSSEPLFGHARPQQRPPENRGVASLHACSLDMVEYHPLLKLCKDLIKKPPSRVFDDPFQLADIGAALENWRVERTRILKTTRRFEKVGGVRAVTTKRNMGTFWNMLMSTDGCTVTAVRPYTNHFYLVQQCFLPKWRERFTRNTGPAELGCGMQNRAATEQDREQFELDLSCEPGDGIFIYEKEPTCERESPEDPVGRDCAPGFFARLCARSSPTQKLMLESEADTEAKEERARMSTIFAPARRKGYADGMTMNFKVVPHDALSAAMAIPGNISI